VLVIALAVAGLLLMASTTGEQRHARHAPRSTHAVAARPP
jgi:hypothetical protein